MISQQHWYTYLFQVLFVIAVIGVYIHSMSKATHRMAYSLILMCLWGFLVYWNWVS